MLQFSGNQKKVEQKVRENHGNEPELTSRKTNNHTHYTHIWWNMLDKT